MRGIPSTSDNVEVMEFLKPSNVSYSWCLFMKKSFEAYLMNSGMNLGCNSMSKCHHFVWLRGNLHDVRNQHP